MKNQHRKSVEKKHAIFARRTARAASSLDSKHWRRSCRNRLRGWKPRGNSIRTPRCLKHSETFLSKEPWLFVACGSSYYLSQTIAAQWTKLLRVTCTAVPASELLFAPDEVLQRTGARQVVFVSRSGKTTEVLRAAEMLKKQSGRSHAGRDLQRKQRSWRFVHSSGDAAVGR